MPGSHRPLTHPVVERQLDIVLPGRDAPTPATRRFLDPLDTLAAGDHPLSAGVRWAPRS